MKDYFTHGPGMGFFVCFFNLNICFGSTRNTEKDRKRRITSLLSWCHFLSEPLKSSARPRGTQEKAEILYWGISTWKKQTTNELSVACTTSSKAPFMFGPSNEAALHLQQKSLYEVQTEVCQTHLWEILFCSTAVLSTLSHQPLPL